MTPVFHNFRSGPDMQITGIEPTARMLGDIADRAEDMRPAMRVIAELLVEGNEEVFRSKGGAIGTPWPENAPETIRKKRLRSLQGLMVNSGDLEASLTGGTGAAKRATKSSARAGTKYFYAIFHMGVSKGNRLPARPPVGIPEHTDAAAETIMERYLLHGVTA